MTRPATQSEAWDQRAAEQALAPKAPPQVQARRDFYAGALAGAAIPPAQVLRECLDFARTIGTAVEKSR